MDLFCLVWTILYLQYLIVRDMFPLNILKNIVFKKHTSSLWFSSRPMEVKEGKSGTGSGDGETNGSNSGSGCFDCGSPVKSSVAASDTGVFGV